MATTNELQQVLDNILLDKNTNLKPKNLKKDVTVLGVTGTFAINTSDATATAEDILEDKTAYVDDEKLTGTMPNNGSLEYTPSTSQQTIPAGYTSGGTIAAVTSSIDQNITASNIKSGVSILGVNGSVVELNGEERTVDPSTNQQTIVPSVNKNAITSLTVNAVDNTIDPNIVQSNIKAGVTILGVTGNVVPDKPDQTKTCTPTTSQQVIEPDNGYELASVTVNAVTSAIDNNIVAGNIKQGVEILGVTGDLSPSEDLDTELTEQETLLDFLRTTLQGKTAGGGDADLSEYFNLVLTNGNKSVVKKLPSIDTSELTDFQAVFAHLGMETMEEINTDNAYTLQEAFFQCRNLIRSGGFSDTSNVETFYNTFSSCDNLQTIAGTFDLSKVNYLNYTFSGCSRLTQLPTFSHFKDRLDDENNQQYIELNGAFSYCYDLINIPELVPDLESGETVDSYKKKIVNLSYIITYDTNLSYNSLINILKLLNYTNEDSYQSTKTLKALGFSIPQVQLLNNTDIEKYVTSNGWTTGYEDYVEYTIDNKFYDYAGNVLSNDLEDFVNYFKMIESNTIGLFIHNDSDTWDYNYTAPENILNSIYFDENCSDAYAEIGGSYTIGRFGLDSGIPQEKLIKYHSYDEYTQYIKFNLSQNLINYVLNNDIYAINITAGNYNSQGEYWGTTASVGCSVDDGKLNNLITNGIWGCTINISGWETELYDVVNVNSEMLPNGGNWITLKATVNNDNTLEFGKNKVFNATIDLPDNIE